MRCLSEILHGVHGYAAGIREGGRAQVALCRVPALDGAQGHIQRTAIEGIGRYVEHGLVYVAQAALLEPRLHLRARSK
ncbi:MAG: hypothetical protein OXD43_13330 [Bacteroidetes bacterium]|nr:hypothetical protein [Bacteroidota bacterium]